MIAKILSEESVLAALSTVEEPELHKDLVTLKMIRDLVIKEGEVSFSILLTTPACPLRNRIENEARTAVKRIPGVSNVVIRFDANVPFDGRNRTDIKLNVKNVVAIASGKGGVGKSTVAVNIAISLAQCGAKVGLLDADIYGPNIPTMMGVDFLPPSSNGRITPAEAYGVKVMSIGFLIEPGQPLIWRGPMLHTAIRQFLTDVEWGDLDYLIVDLPPGTGDAQLSLTQLIPLSGGIIVTLPQKVSYEDAVRGMQMFRETNVPVLGVVENMSYLQLADGTQMEIFGSGGGKRLAEESKTAFLGSIPMDPMVRSGGDSGKPIIVSNPDSAPARALKDISGLIAAELSISALAEGR